MPGASITATQSAACDSYGTSARMSAEVTTAKVTTLTEPKCAPIEALSTDENLSTRKNGNRRNGIRKPSVTTARTSGTNSSTGCLDNSRPPLRPIASKR